jgi:glycosyltransferase involved in cell wall biosynthesis
MAMGRPIVSTSVSMIPEILDGCGLLVSPGDPRALRTGIETLLGDPGRARELGRRARERCIERYSFTSARATLLPLIDRVVAG